MEAEGYFGGEVVGNIDVVPSIAYEDAVPGMLDRAVGSGIAIDNVTRDALASVDGGEEAGDIVADTCLGLQSFTNVAILIKAVVVMIVGKVPGHPRICRKHLIFIG